MLLGGGKIKKKLIICGIITVIFLFFVTERVNVGFAEKITLKYQHGNKNINLQITDKNDFEVLKSICNGLVVNDFSIPSCGFGSAEIIFEGNGKKISLFPACDGCSTMRFNNSDKYYSIGTENRKKLVEILGKYGATFPCV